MDERTEDAALRGILTVSMGGQPYQLRTLTIDESDDWLGKLATGLSSVELPEGADGTAAMRALLTASSAAVASLVAAYDLDGILGGLAVIRGRMSKRELRAALDAMVTAEDPFGEDAARSVAEVFGAPSRFLAAGMRMVMAQIASPLAASTNGRSRATASTSDASAANGAASSSSSDGRTPRSASVARRRTG